MRRIGTGSRGADRPGRVAVAGGVILALALAPGLGEASDPGISTPLARTEFPHDVHVVDNELECTECHASAPRPEEAAADLPSPEVCADCHEAADVAPYFPVGSYHGADYARRHALEASAGVGSCTACHEGSETCTMCHHGENLDLLSHPRNWLFLHSIESRNGTMECAACHSDEQYCSDCHAQERVLPGSHRLAGWGRGVIHGSEARRDPTYCASCHAGQEPVCVECHSLER